MQVKQRNHTIVRFFSPFKDIISRLPSLTYFQIRWFLRNQLVVSFEDLTLRYATSSLSAKKWFYPRYASGGVHEPPVAKLVHSHLDQARFDLF